MEDLTLKALHPHNTLAVTLAASLGILAGSLGFSPQASAGICQLVDGAASGGCVRSFDIKNKSVNSAKLANGIIPYVTIVKYNGETTDSSPSTTIKFLRNAGAFTKQQAGTAVKLTWIGHGSVAGLSCFYQLRVNGQTESGTSSLTGGAIVNNYDSADENDVQQFAVTAYFQDLPAGVLDIDVWDRGVSASACTLNPGNWTHTIYVEEVNADFLPQAFPSAEPAADDSGLTDSEIE